MSIVRDIESKADIIEVLSHFYKYLAADPQVEHIFAHLDMDHHILHIAGFWDAIVLGGPAFQGNPFAKHIFLHLKPEHFEVWLSYFRESFHQHFVGEKVNDMIFRAESIAQIFQKRLGLIA